MYFINVEFEAYGREYCYASPIQVEEGSLVLVNVYGTIKCVRVTETDVYPPAGIKIKQIVGIGVLLEDMDSTPKQKSSWFSRLFGVGV